MQVEKHPPGQYRHDDREYDRERVQGMPEFRMQPFSDIGRDIQSRDDKQECKEPFAE
jgi:hypothetical protein